MSSSTTASKATCKHRILNHLIRALRGEVFEWAVPDQIKIPTGWLPMYSFQRAEIGGSAANVRISELKAPEGTRVDNSACGIPVEKRTFSFDTPSGGTRIHCYRLDMRVENIDKFIDFPNLRLNKLAIQQAGAMIIEHEESVRIVAMKTTKSPDLFASA